MFPIHPVTRERLGDRQFKHFEPRAGVLCIGPASYLEFVSLQAAAGAIVTDSATVQEEASALGVSCFTVHASTERPLTITHGTNVLLGDEAAEIADVRPAAHEPTPSAIPLWDGKAAERVADALVANYALMPGAAGVHQVDGGLSSVCSSGGHLLQLHELRPAWEPFDRTKVTFDKSDARSLLSRERVIPPTARPTAASPTCSATCGSPGASSAASGRPRSSPRAPASPSPSRGSAGCTGSRRSTSRASPASRSSR